MNLMFIEVVEFKGKHFPAIFAKMFPRALGFSSRLSEKRGTLRDQIPLPVMVVTFIGLMFAFFLFSRNFSAFTDLGDPRKMLHQIVDIYLNGILSPDTDDRKDQ
jgi:hypothetical protein